MNAFAFTRPVHVGSTRSCTERENRPATRSPSSSTSAPQRALCTDKASLRFSSRPFLSPVPASQPPLYCSLRCRSMSLQTNTSSKDLCSVPCYQCKARLHGQVCYSPSQSTGRAMPASDAIQNGASMITRLQRSPRHFAAANVHLTSG
jgi:hypothetical protein